MTKIYEYKKEIVSSKRDIKEFVAEYNITWYKVIFTNTIRYTFKLFGILVKEYIKTESKVSNLNFSNGLLSLAREYAKKAEKCDELTGNTFTCAKVEIFPPDYKKVAKFGKYVLNDLLVDQYQSNYVWFIYDPKWSHGDKIVKEFRDLFNHEYINDVVLREGIEINEAKTIESYDYITMKTIPIEELNASSEEIKQLQAILKDFKESQEKYINFLEKLNNK